LSVWAFSLRWGRDTLAANGYCEDFGVCRMCMAALARALNLMIIFL